MVGQAVLAAALQDLEVVEVYLVGVILKSMACSQLISESPPLHEPPLLPSPDQLLPILPVPPLFKPSLRLALNTPPRNCVLLILSIGDFLLLINYKLFFFV